MKPTTISAEAFTHCHQRQEHIFNDFCMEAIKLLRKSPQGLTVAAVQKSVGMSYKTTMRVLALVAVERDGKFYPKPKGVRKSNRRFRHSLNLFLYQLQF